MIALLTAVLLASFLGSLHCVGMCGGLVAFYSGGSTSGRGRMAGHAAYSGGRLLSYVAVGCIAGGAGALVDLSGSLAGWQGAATLVAGLLILLWGLASLFPRHAGRLSRFGAPVGARLGVSAALRKVATAPPALRALLIGLLSTLLPCGWLYAFVLAAAGTGDPVRGGAVMAAFWLGTVPALLGLGLGSQALARRLGGHLARGMAIATIIVGLATLSVRWWGLGGAWLPPARGFANVEEVTVSVEALDPSKMPCCDGD